MRLLQSSVFRAICAIAIGILLIKFPDNTVTGITIAIGVLFLVSGLVSCIAYLQARRHVGEYKIYDAEGNLVSGTMPAFPLVGVGSIILGLILALSPTAFVSALMYIIGAMLILGAVNLFWGLIAGRRFGNISLGFFILPTLILITGLYVMIKPLTPVNVAMLVLGWCTLIYGIAELINALKFYSNRKKLQRENTPQLAEEIFEEVKE
jgi:uncharacterized membrane protein HdeD (DUF308 family)